MGPVPIISGISSRERRTSFYLNRELTSVLAPGIVAVMELSYLFARLRSSSATSHLLSPFARIGGTAGLLLILVAVSLGYVTGYVSRELAFMCLGQLEKIRSIREDLETDTNRRLHKYFSDELIIKVFRIHPCMRLDQRDTLPQEPAADLELAGGGNVENTEYENFTYAKLWIRNYAPEFSIDSTELEINITAGALLPTLLLSADITVSFSEIWWAVVLVALALASIWYILVKSLLRLRRTERWEAIRNLILDYAMRCASQDYPLAELPAANSSNASDQAESARHTDP